MQKAKFALRVERETYYNATHSERAMNQHQQLQKTITSSPPPAHGIPSLFYYLHTPHILQLQPSLLLMRLK